jgi:hypothetical protein
MRAHSCAASHANCHQLLFSWGMYGIILNTHIICLDRTEAPVSAARPFALDMAMLGMTLLHRVPLQPVPPLQVLEFPNAGAADCCSLPCV